MKYAVVRQGVTQLTVQASMARFDPDGTTRLTHSAYRSAPSPANALETQ